MAEAGGPIWAGGFEHETAEGYRIQFLPDKHNDDLQKAGKAPIYYYMPTQVRLARKNGTGDYKFHLVHFVGVQGANTNVGVEGTREVAGGVLSFTTTSGFPAGVLKEAEEQLLRRYRGNDDKYWGWRTPVAPMFRAVPITANMTAITNLSPDANGVVPAAGGGTAPAQPETPATPDGNGGVPAPVSGGPPRSTIAVRPADMTGRVVHGPGFRAPSSLDAWHWQMQGQGSGSIVPDGENSYSGLIGDLPAAIVWQGFHGSYSPISVVQALKIPVWSQALKITLEGHWDRIFQHFSTHAKANNWWWNADIKAEFNNLRTSGGIKVIVEVDETMPDADKMEAMVTKQIDAVYNKFMEVAQKVIFDAATPTVTAAKAGGGGGLLGWGGGFALNYRRDSTKLDLKYTSEYHKRYNMEHVISSTLEGFYDEIKRDPSAERKYFTTLYLEDWSRKVTRIVKPVVNWPDPTRKWVGEPVAFLSVELGYPSARGDIQWVPRVFQSTDTGDMTRWDMAVAKKNFNDVVNPPAGWTPDKMFVRRRVHLNEPPSETDSPFMKVFVEKNVIDLDPGVNGSLSSENTLEVRADSAGKLEVGPIMLSDPLENEKQMVEVEFQCLGTRHDGRPRNSTKFLWKFNDQDESRYWEIFTGQLDFVPAYRYRVRVIVRGSIFTRGMEWIGPWNDVSGNGPLTVALPKPEDEGVTRRSLIGVNLQEPAPAISGNGGGNGGGIGRPPVTTGIGAPPTRMAPELGSPTSGLPMRKLESEPVGIGLPGRSVGGYSLDPMTPRSSISPPPPIGKTKEESSPSPRDVRIEVPSRLELADGWKTMDDDSDNGHS